MKMYRVLYGDRSWWTSAPQIEEREVVKRTPQTVVYKEPIRRWADGEYKETDMKECREHIGSKGIRWFDDFESAKLFAINDQETKLRISEDRSERLRENLEKLRCLDS